MQRLRTVTSLDVSAVAGHHAMPAALLFASLIANLTMCTAVLQKDFLTVLRFCIYLLILIDVFCNIAVLIVEK